MFDFFTRFLMANMLTTFILDTFAGNTSTKPMVLSRSAQRSPAHDKDNSSDNDSPAQPTIMKTVTITIAQPSSPVPWG